MMSPAEQVGALPDVAATLRIRLPFLEAIEDGRVADLPGNAYAVGFLRTYASSLGLDAAEVARRFRAEAQEVNRKTELAFPAPVPERGVPAGAVMYLLTHATAVPAIGFQRWPWQLPRAAVAWESGSHLVFGAGLETARGPIRKLLG